MYDEVMALLHDVPYSWPTSVVARVGQQIGGWSQ